MGTNIEMNKKPMVIKRSSSKPWRVLQDLSNRLHTRTLSLSDLKNTKKNSDRKDNSQKCDLMMVSCINTGETRLSPIKKPSISQWKASSIEDELDRSGDVLDRLPFGTKIIKYLKKKDDMCILRNGIMGYDKDETRTTVVDWIIRVATYRKTCQRTLHLSILLLDMCIYINPMDLDRLQLLSITCYLLANKYEESVYPTLSRLVDLTDKSYTKQNIIDMEMYVLSTLDFDLGTPTPVPFLARLLSVYAHSLKIHHMSNYILDLLLCSGDAVKFSSSLKAASSLYMARSITLHMDELADDKTIISWPNNLIITSTYRECDMVIATRRIAKLLLRSEKSQHKAARCHYRSDKYFNISLLPEMNDSLFLRECSQTCRL